MTEQLAAALLALGHIPFEHAREMTAAQIISLYQFDHWPIRVEAGGTNHPSNLRPLLIMAHRKKTARDHGEIAKIRRTRRKQDEHDERMRQKRREIKIFSSYDKRRRWPSRPFPKREKKRRRHRAVAVAAQ